MKSDKLIDKLCTLEEEGVDRILLPAGKIITFDGIPLILKEDAFALGNLKNFLVKKEENK